jgi:hypothetical protein
MIFTLSRRVKAVASTLGSLEKGRLVAEVNAMTREGLLF